MTALDSSSVTAAARAARLAVRAGVQASDRSETQAFLSVYAGLLPEVRAETFPRPARREAIREALATDHVLTAGQLRRYFGADAADLASLARVRHQVEPVHMRGTLVEAEFCALKVSEITMRPSVLAHAVGTAEVRLQLGIPPQAWKTAGGGDEDVEPDAIYTTPEGKRLAVEYDRGTYPSKKITYKLLSFGASFDGTLWAVPPPVVTRSGQPPERNRKQRVRDMVALQPELARLRKTLHVMTVCWWQDETVIVDKAAARLSDGQGRAAGR